MPVHGDAGGAGEEGGGALWMDGGRVRGGRGAADGGAADEGRGVRDLTQPLVHVLADLQHRIAPAYGGEYYTPLWTAFLEHKRAQTVSGPPQSQTRSLEVSKRTRARTKHWSSLNPYRKTSFASKKN